MVGNDGEAGTMDGMVGEARSRLPNEGGTALRHVNKHMRRHHGGQVRQLRFGQAAGVGSHMVGRLGWKAMSGNVT